MKKFFIVYAKTYHSRFGLNVTICPAKATSLPQGGSFRYDDHSVDMVIFEDLGQALDYARRCFL